MSIKTKLVWSPAWTWIRFTDSNIYICKIKKIQNNGKYILEALAVTAPDHSEEQYEHYPINSCNFSCSYQMLHTKVTKRISHNIIVFLWIWDHKCIFVFIQNHSTCQRSVSHSSWLSHLVSKLVCPSSASGLTLGQLRIQPINTLVPGSEKGHWCYVSLVNNNNNGSIIFVSCHGDVITWKCFPHHCPFVGGIRLSLLDSYHKGPLMQSYINFFVVIDYIE